MRIRIVENRIGINQELNGYIIYCSNKLKTRDSWWSNPGEYFGDIDYIQRRGYHNIKTHADCKLFSQLAMIEMSIIKNRDDRFYFESKNKKAKNKFFFHEKGSRIVCTNRFESVFRLTASQVKEYIDRDIINLKYYNIKKHEVLT